MALKSLEAVKRIRSIFGKNVKRVTRGLQDNIIGRFDGDQDLMRALATAEANLKSTIESKGTDFFEDEDTMMKKLQSGYVNFYHPDSIMPFIPVAAQGPWIVTLHGAVIHDSGGYGMLGFGHNNDAIQEANSKPQCMANVMTPSFSQAEFVDALRSQIGWSREGKECPYAAFVCLNSGSEAVEFSTRVTDVHAKLMTGPGGVHEGRPSTMMVMEGGFYGRTYRPARLSESCRDIYKEHLASFQYGECHLPMVVEPNNIDSLEEAFGIAEERKVHVEALYIEPLMGEGQPGKKMNRDFYDRARQLSRENNSLLIIDSIQAALRATGSLSICDYPGFEDADAPDMETYSKALNAGQYPLSVLALQQGAADVYQTGLYGNTMTTNPRALDIATTTLNMCTPDIRANILTRGDEIDAAFNELVKKYPSVFTNVTGSGMLQAIHLSPDVSMFGGNTPGTKSFLSRCRQSGLGVINAAHTIKFTTHFQLSKPEVELMAEVLSEVAEQEIEMQNKA